MADKFDWNQYPVETPNSAPAAAAGAGKFDWNQYPTEAPASGRAPESWSDYGRAALTAAEAGLAKLDSYTGAPYRAAISAGMKGNYPFNTLGNAQRLGNAASAYVKQFGQDSAKAPTGQDIAEQAGLPQDSALSKVAGFGVDIGTNPLTYLPVGEAVSAGSKFLGSGAKAVQAAAEGAPEAGSLRQGVAKVAGYVGDQLTGVNKNLTEHYVANTDKINGLINQYGENAADQAADLRNSWRGVVQDTRKAMNTQISQALAAPEADIAAISAKPVEDSLQKAYSAAHPVTQVKDRQAIQGMQDMLTQMTDADGNISLKDLHAFKMHLQDLAEPTYDGAGNAIFPGGKFAAQAANKSAGTARQILIKQAPEEVSNAEATLSKLHGVEDTMNRNLLAPESAYHAVMRAGTDAGGGDARILKELGAITGHDFLSEAKDFATSRFFQKTPIMPLDSTGKSFTRMAIAGTGAAALGSLNDQDWKQTALMGAALVSPAALKLGVNAANTFGKAGAAVGRAITAIPPAPVAGALTSNAGSARPLQWAQQGLGKLGIQDPNYSQKLLSDPKTRDLLIQASDLAPGSQAMKNIQNQIQTRWGGPIRKVGGSNP